MSSLFPSITITVALAFITPAFAQIPAFPTSFEQQTVTVPDGTVYHVRTGGSGPAVLLLHGYTQTGAMWGNVAAALSEDHTVIVPDLAGLGASTATPDEDFRKVPQAEDMRDLLDQLEIEDASVVGHDIGTMVAYAFAAQFPERTRKLVLMEAPLPGVTPWEQVRANPQAWHLNFHGPIAEALTEGRERIWFDKFWDGFSADPTAIDEEARVYYTDGYARPGGMAAGFAQFAALEHDAEDNARFAQSKLTMPVLAVGGEKAQGGMMGMIAEAVASDVTSAIVAGAGHWLTEEASEATSDLVRDFLNGDAS